MNFLEAIILGIIQGLTEFIPISSTAHLTIAGKLMGLIDSTNPEFWTANIAIIQLGTLIAVLIYFYRDIKKTSAAFLRENVRSGRLPISKQSDYSRMGWLVIIGSLPVFTVGFAFKKIIEGNLTKELSVIAGSLILLAILLYFAERTAKLRKEIKDITIVDALWVGFAQCLALIPGSSRSGTTITAGLFLGLNRETAARFSFLLSIPAIFVSGIYQFYKSIGHIHGHDIIMLTISTIFAGISGYLSIAFLINYLKKKTTFIFVVYRIILGLLLAAFIWFGVIK
jgi:undecaprenyl-diphosphatase